MQNLYLFVESDKSDDCIKYGIKLSEYSDMVIRINDNEKKGIVAYLSPKDSDKFLNKDYTCLKISSTQTNITVYNQVFEQSIFFSKNVIKLEDYVIGSFEEPIALICSSILPENIFIYNEDIDSPLIVQDSKNYYYLKSIYEILDSEIFSSHDIFQALLNLGKHNKIFKSVEKLDDNIKNIQKEVLEDIKNKKKYILKNNTQPE